MTVVGWVLAQSFTEWGAQQVADVKSLVVAVIALLAVCFIATTWWTTKALVPTVTAMLLAGGVLYAVNNVDWFEGRIADQVRSAPPLLAPADPPAVDGPGWR